MPLDAWCGLRVREQQPMVPEHLRSKGLKSQLAAKEVGFFQSFPNMQ